MVNDITKQERKNGIKIRYEYQQEIKSIQKQISEYRGTITELKNKIGGLEKQIENARPKLDGASMLCDKCDIVSMKYTRMVPGQGEREQWYECITCGYERYWL